MFKAIFSSHSFPQAQPNAPPLRSRCSYRVPAAQAAASPFANLGGAWSGPGVITLNTGATEKIRCRATYTVDRDGAPISASRCVARARPTIST